MKSGLRPLILISDFDFGVHLGFVDVEAVVVVGEGGETTTCVLTAVMRLAGVRGNLSLI
jgi:hypothetical protein